MALPASYTSFTTPGAPTEGLNSPNHSTVHAEIKDSLVGIEQTIGTAGSTSADTVLGRMGATGTNFITNGAASVAQNGNPNVIDGWGFKTNFSSGYTITRVASTPGSEVPVQVGDYLEPGDGYYAKYVIPSGSPTNYCYVAFPIEDVRTLSGQTATFSIYAKSDSGSAPISVAATQNFGVGGSTQVLVSVTSSAGVNLPVTTTSSWARYSFTIAFPSVTGKTIGDNNRIVIRLSMASISSSAITVPGGTYSFWGAQLEAGTFASRFKREDFSQTFMRCQKYYCVVDPGVVGVASTSSVAVFQEKLPVAGKASQTGYTVTNPTNVLMLGSNFTIQVVNASPTPGGGDLLTATGWTYMSDHSVLGRNLVLYLTGLSGLTVNQPLLWKGSSFGVDWFPTVT